MPKAQYYTLISSLPHVPYFEGAQHVPINEQRLRRRFSMLEPEHAKIVSRLIEYLGWRYQPVERTDEDVVAHYRKVASCISSEPVLMSLVEAEMSDRTIIAALRRRHRGLSKPNEHEIWGIGRWVKQIEKNWDDADFKLRTVLPWIPQARSFVESGEALALEKLLLDITWKRAGAVWNENPFTFEMFIAYLFKWSTVFCWLTYNRDRACERFNQLVTEVTSEKEKLFDK